MALFFAHIILAHIILAHIVPAHIILKNLSCRHGRMKSHVHRASGHEKLRTQNFLGLEFGSSSIQKRYNSYIQRENLILNHRNVSCLVWLTVYILFRNKGSNFLSITYRKKVCVATCCLWLAMVDGASMEAQIHVKDKLHDQNGWNFDTKISICTL